MDTRQMRRKIRSIQRRYRKVVGRLNEECKEFEGMDAVVPYGRYRGRKGKIEKAYVFNDGRVRAIIIPYRLKGDIEKYGELLVNNCNDLRTYWPLERAVCK